MINHSLPSCSFPHYDLQTKEEAKIAFVTPTPTSTNINVDTLFNIIKTNTRALQETYGQRQDILGQIPSNLKDIRRHPNYKKWKSKISEDFKLIIDNFLTSFAIKLNETNCGSWEEKKYFLSFISEKIGIDYPFKMINDSITNFVEKKIALTVAKQAVSKIKDLSNSDNENYNEITKFIHKKAEENLFDENNKLEFVNAISEKIYELHKGQYEYLKYKIKFNYSCVKIDSFTIFYDLYHSHLVGSYDFIMSKSIEIFENLGHYKKCFISFAFDTFFGEMIISNEAEKLRNILYKHEYSLAINSKYLIKNLVFSGKINFFNEYEKKDTGINKCDYNNMIERSDELTSFIVQSQKELKKEIKRYFLETNTIVIEENIVTTCSREIEENILRHSSKYLKKKLISYIIRNYEIFSGRSSIISSLVST